MRETTLRSPGRRRDGHPPDLEPRAPARLGLEGGSEGPGRDHGRSQLCVRAACGNRIGTAIRIVAALDRYDEQQFLRLIENSMTRTTSLGTPHAEGSRDQRTRRHRRHLLLRARRPSRRSCRPSQRPSAGRIRRTDSGDHELVRDGILLRATTNLRAAVARPYRRLPLWRRRKLQEPEGRGVTGFRLQREIAWPSGSRHGSRSDRVLPSQRRIHRILKRPQQRVQHPSP